MTIARLSDLADTAVCPLLVIKVGSSLLVNRDGVRRAWLRVWWPRLPMPDVGGSG